MSIPESNHAETDAMELEKFLAEVSAHRKKYGGSRVSTPEEYADMYHEIEGLGPGLGCAFLLTVRMVMGVHRLMRAEDLSFKEATIKAALSMDKADAQRITYAMGIELPEAEDDETWGDPEAWKESPAKEPQQSDEQ